MEFSHIPVLLQPCLDGLNIDPAGIYLECDRRRRTRQQRIRNDVDTRRTSYRRFDYYGPGTSSVGSTYVRYGRVRTVTVAGPAVGRVRSTALTLPFRYGPDPVPVR